jgi:hypothetical protein
MPEIGCQNRAKPSHDRRCTGNSIPDRRSHHRGGVRGVGTKRAFKKGEVEEEASATFKKDVAMFGTVMLLASALSLAFMVVVSEQPPTDL